MKKKVLIIVIILLLSSAIFATSYVKQSTFTSIDECLISLGIVNSDRPMKIVINKLCEVTGIFKGERGKTWACKCNKNGSVTGWYDPR